MTKTALALMAVLLTGASACSNVQYTRTSRYVFRAKAPSCAFDVLTASPERKIMELGLLENLSCDGGPCETVGEFRDLVKTYVCQAGGDAVVVMVNGLGRYVKGVVIKYLR